MSTAPAPGTPEWARVVSASKVAAILALSPWDSQRSMWHFMRGEIPNKPETRPMRRGNMLENAILDWFLADHPTLTEIRRQPVYMLDGETWALATPDMDVTNTETGDLELVDAKTAGTADEFGAEGTDAIPTHYLASSMWQLAMAPKAQRVHLAVLTGRPFDIAYYVVERDDDLIGNIIDKCRAFYDSLTSDVPPPLDDSVATYDAIRKLHPDIDRDAVVELTEDEARAFTLSNAQATEWEARAREAKSAVLERMGSARLATFSGQPIARRQPNKYGVSLVAVAKSLDALDTESENVA